MARVNEGTFKDLFNDARKDRAFIGLAFTMKVIDNVDVNSTGRMSKNRFTQIQQTVLEMQDGYMLCGNHMNQQTRFPPLADDYDKENIWYGCNQRYWKHGANCIC